MLYLEHGEFQEEAEVCNSCDISHRQNQNKN